MSLYRYLKPMDGILPFPTGPLSAHTSPATIREVNKEVQKTNVPSYLKMSGEQQVKIAHYASLHGNTATVHHFLKTSSHCFHLKSQLFGHYSSNSTRYICGKGINVIN